MPIKKNRRGGRRRTVFGGISAAACLIGALALAPAVEAKCPGQAPEKPFAAVHDKADYVAFPNGSLEDGTTGWTLGEGARLRSHQNPFRLDPGSNALFLPAGSWAVSPPVCVGEGSPTARMFAKTVVKSPASGATLKAEVLYLQPSRSGRTIKKVGNLPDEVIWSATRKFSLSQGQLGIKPGSGATRMIRYRFTPLYRTSWVIDDLFVDPRARY